MLSAFTKFLLDYIKDKSKNGFIVVEIGEILDAYPNSNLVDEKSVLTAFDNLSNFGYVNLKYNDGKLFCVCITEKGKSYGENNYLCEKQESSYKIIGWVIFGAFIGGFLGSLICNLLTFLIY